jgi:hypothetical protein
MKKIAIITLGAFAVLAASCKKDKTAPIECVDEISFSADVQPIIMNSCATSGCHSGPNASNNMNFMTYEAVFEHRVLIGRSVRHESGVTPMPFGPQLSAENISKITCWIEQGAPNN